MGSLMQKSVNEGWSANRCLLRWFKLHAFSVGYGPILFISFALISLATPPLLAQWRQLDVGGAGGINAIMVSGSDLFAGANAGIYRSTESGMEWNNVNGSFTKCFITDGSILFAGTVTGILASTDGGSTWLNPDSGFAQSVNALAVQDSTIFAGTESSGIFTSTDGGQSWVSADGGLSPYQYMVSGIAVSGSEVFATTAAGLCMTTDGGIRWSTVSIPLLSVSKMTNCVAVRDSTVLVGTPGGLFMSTDDGSSWGRANGLTNNTSVFSVAVDSPYVYAGTVSGVYVSADNGLNWTDASSGLPGGQIRAVAAAGSYLFAGTFDSAVYVSTDNGKSWLSENSGLSGGTVVWIAGRGTDLFVVMDNNVIRSTDNGDSWTASDSGLPDSYISSVTATDSALYAVTKGIYKSTDNGATWLPINGGIMNTQYPTYLAVSGSNLVAGTEGFGMFLSINGGKNWAHAAGAPANLYVLSMASDGEDVFASCLSGVYRSTDRGVSWTEVSDTLTNINALAVAGSFLFAGRILRGYPVGSPPSPPGAVFRSTDGGKTWEPFLSGLPNQFGEGPQVQALASHGNDIFCGLENDLGVYASSDIRDNWVDMSGNLPDLDGTSIYANDSDLFVGFFEGGLWERPLSQVTAVRPATGQLPSSFALLQNYPNPFNPSTVIRFDVPSSGLVTLRVYNVLGQLVKTLVDKVESPGSHQVTFTGAGLASGVYFYRIDGGGSGGRRFVAVRKLMLVK